MPKIISEFQGEWRFLSNFYPCTNMRGGTLEHEFQAAKFLNMMVRFQIYNAFSPGTAKRLAYHLGPIRPDWEEIKIGIMHELLRRKFANPKLQAMLLVTGDTILEEGNNWGDRFWGICPPGPHGTGKNFLGRLLMQVRDEIRRGG